MTRRNQYLVGVLAVIGLVGAFFLFALKPKLTDLSKAREDVAEAEHSLQTARQEGRRLAQARLEFPRAYATMARLGKAVPANDDEASALFQLNHAAALAGVNFTQLMLTTETTSSGGDASGTEATPPRPPGGSGNQGENANQQNNGGYQQGKSGEQSGSPTASSTYDTLGSAPADALVTAALPTGARTGAADLRVMHFELKFRGRFFKLEDFLHNVKNLVRTWNKRLFISGRLVTIDGIEFTRGNIAMTATDYLVPPGQGLFAGATPRGPGGMTEETPQVASTSGNGGNAPPSAVVTKP